MCISATTMKLEIRSASGFLMDLLRLSNNASLVNDSQLQLFRDFLTDLLVMHYRDHWFPEKPFKGSGYRCIRVNGTMDPIVAQAGVMCGLDPQFLHSLFPSELTLWIDPKEVSYRIGENGSICVLYEEPKSSSIQVTSKCGGGMWQDNSGMSVTSLRHSNWKDKMTCKESLRNLDFFDHSNASFEQLATYVSS